MTPPRRPSAIVALVALVVTLLAAPAVARADDPALEWRTLETPHFRIHFYLAETRLARRLAVVAEDAHRKLVPVLGHAPRDRTEIVLSDTTDSPNGFTFEFPYPHVTLFATAPDDRSELNDYDDWLSELFMHEYTHVLHLDTIHGLARVVNYLLGFGERGRLFVPNQYQPRFLIEGLAVFEETTRSSAGRLRSSIYDMWLRQAALEGKLLRLDQVSANPIQFPRGGAAYLYGSAFLRYLAGRFGADALRRYSHEYGGAWIPGGINRAFRHVTGHTFTALYDDFTRALVDHYRAVAARLAKEGLTPTRVLTPARDYAARPTFTRDGRSVVWADSDGYSRTQLRVVTPAGAWADPAAPRPAARTFHPVDGVGGSTFSRDGGTLYFAALDLWRTIYLYGDLYALDVASGERRQLTSGLRAEDPDLSPDGRTLAFVANSGGYRSLLLLATDDPAARPRTLVTGEPDLSQMYTPAFSPDGRRIAFSWWRPGGFRDLYVVDVASGALEQVTHDRALDVDPRFSPDGRYLYFSSDRSGVYDLYAWDIAARKLRRVTRVQGGVFDVAVSPDGARAAFVGFEAEGWRLETLALDPARFVDAEPAPDDRPEVTVPAGEPPLPSRPYSPWGTLWPRTLGFSSYPDAFGQVLALRLAATDVLDHHTVSLALGVGLGRADDVSFVADYTWRGSWPTFGLRAGRGLARRDGLFVNGLPRAFVEDDYAVDAAVSLPVIRSFDHASDLSLSYTFAYARDTHDVRVPLDPNTITPRFPETGQLSTVTLSWAWSNARRFLFSVGAETGRSIGLSLSASLRTIGSRYDVYTASWYWAEHVPMPWRSHALSLVYQGGVSGGDVTRRAAFYLGGYAPQPDPLRALYDFSRPGPASLRGYAYAQLAGDQFHLLTVEYRLPIAWIERGYQTFPLYLRRLHAAGFTDVGNAFYGAFDPGALKVGSGVELRLELTYGYYYNAALQLGYAHGFMSGGEDQVYFLLNNPF